MPLLLESAAASNHGVAEFSSTLVSDAMHLRSIYSHRWTAVALRAYKLRNSHTYRLGGFILVLLHVLMLSLEAPRGEWELLPAWLRWFTADTQATLTTALNIGGLALYALDLLYVRARAKRGGEAPCPPRPFFVC